MAHYAKVEDGKVTQVIVAEQEIIDSGLFGPASQWIQTSYNTIAGRHTAGGTPLRKNYAGVGYTYDETRDAFIPPSPFPSWVLNEETCTWESPVPYPTDIGTPENRKKYAWNEETTTWDLIVVPV